MKNMVPDLTCDINGLKLKNPVLTASGTFGIGKDFKDFYDVNLLGGIITKTVTWKKRDGKKPPRIAETRSGIINSIGLPNPGVKAFIEESREWLERLTTCVIISVAVNTEEEYSDICACLKDGLKFDAVELNVSCPNIKKGGRSFGQDPESVNNIISRVKKQTGLFVIAKLAPWTHLIGEVAQAAEAGGADALSVSNTIPAMAVDLRTFRSRIGNITGGLSGPAIKPVCQKLLYDVIHSVSIPVMGIGGIESAEDALEYMVLGAAAVQVGSANMYNPLAGKLILQGIEEYMAEYDYRNIMEIQGKFSGGTHGSY